jgi:hypothetical protein
MEAMNLIVIPIAAEAQRRALDGAITERDAGQAPRTTRRTAGRVRRRGTS